MLLECSGLCTLFLKIFYIYLWIITTSIRFGRSSLTYKYMYGFNPHERVTSVCTFVGIVLLFVLFSQKPRDMNSYITIFVEPKRLVIDFERPSRTCWLYILNVSSHITLFFFLAEFKSFLVVGKHIFVCRNRMSVFSVWFSIASLFHRQI